MIDEKFDSNILGQENQLLRDPRRTALTYHGPECPVGLIQGQRFVDH